jgi:integrase
MARQSNGPWWNADKGKWFVWHVGRKVNLKTDDEREAVRRWHRLMAGDVPEPRTQHPVTPPPIPDTPKCYTLTVKQLADAFLADADKRMSKACRRNYTLFLNAFTAEHGGKDAETVNEADVDGVSRNPKWSVTYRSGFIGCVLTVYRWGLRNKVIGTNPIGDMKKPPKESRGADAVVSQDVHERLLAHADPMFGDFLRLLWATGARPGEVTSITTDMVKRMANGVIPLKEHKTAGKGKSRTLILNPDAVVILQRWAVGREGKLFPFTRKAVTSRMDRLRKKAGVSGVIAYGYRHTFATDALSNGVPDATVAALLGHCDTSMIHRHYSHLSSRTQALRDAVGKVRG